MNEDNDVLLRQLFRDDALDSGSTEVDEGFIQQVMQDVMARQRRRLLFEGLPLVVTVVTVMTVFMVMLVPFFTQLPSLLAGLSAEAGAPVSELMSLADAGSGSLLPVLVLVLALLLPAVVERAPRLLSL